MSVSHHTTACMLSFHYFGQFHRLGSFLTGGTEQHKSPSYPLELIARDRLCLVKATINLAALSSLLYYYVCVWFFMLKMCQVALQLRAVFVSFRMLLWIQMFPMFLSYLSCDSVSCHVVLHVVRQSFLAYFRYQWISLVMFSFHQLRHLSHPSGSQTTLSRQASTILLCSLVAPLLTSLQLPSPTRFYLFLSC